MNALHRHPRARRAALLAATLAALGALAFAAVSHGQDKTGARAVDKTGAPDTRKDAAKGQAKPTLSVALVAPRAEQWPQGVRANGNIAAWQEAVIGAEIAGQRIVEVAANVGDTVKKGQLLARLNADTVSAELAQARAAAAEAEATLAEAKANADRARQIQASGALSAQQVAQYLTAEQTALARLNSAKARVQSDELRLAQTRVLAPDDGVISARAATVGSLAQPGQELFRLIRGGRLEWRAEVTASELARLRPGQVASLVPAGADAAVPIRGRVRIVAPTVDPQTRNAIVYVDLPAGSAARAGMFARGEFELAATAALTLPQTAVLLREGFAYVYTVDANGRVAQVKVEIGRRSGERIEIVRGLDAGARVVESGVAFLADGDLVRVTEPRR